MKGATTDAVGAWSALICDGASLCALQRFGWSAPPMPLAQSVLMPELLVDGAVYGHA